MRNLIIATSTFVVLALAREMSATQTRRGVVAYAGSNAEAPAPDAIVPFKIHVSDEVLRDLKERLTRTRFPDEIEGSGWEYGANLTYMKELVAYWRDRFDWRKQEAELNKFDQFKTNIDG